MAGVALVAPLLAAAEGTDGHLLASMELKDDVRAGRPARPPAPLCFTPATSPARALPRPPCPAGAPGSWGSRVHPWQNSERGLFLQMVVSGRELPIEFTFYNIGDSAVKDVTLNDESLKSDNFEIISGESSSFPSPLSARGFGVCRKWCRRMCVFACVRACVRG